MLQMYAENDIFDASDFTFNQTKTEQPTTEKKEEPKKEVADYP